MYIKPFKYSHRCNIVMTKPQAKQQDFGEHPNTTGGHLLARLDCTVEAGDKDGFTLVKQEIWRQIDNGDNDNDDDIVSLIALSEIDWHDNPADYFVDWQRSSVGYIPNQYRSLFTVK